MKARVLKTNEIVDVEPTFSQERKFKWNDLINRTARESVIPSVLVGYYEKCDDGGNFDRGFVRLFLPHQIQILESDNG